MLLVSEELYCFDGFLAIAQGDWKELKELALGSYDGDEDFADPIPILHYFTTTWPKEIDLTYEFFNRMREHMNLVLRKKFFKKI